LAAIVAHKVSYRPIIIGILRVTNLIYTVAGHIPRTKWPMQFS